MKVPYVFFGHLVWVERPMPVPKELQKDSGLRRAWGITYVAKDYRESVAIVASWPSIRAAIGVVRGESADAVVDTHELYDSLSCEPVSDEAK